MAVKCDRYEQSGDRKRWSGILRQRGRRPSLPARRLLIFFAVPSVAVGSALWIFAPNDPARSSAIPIFGVALVVFGCVFSIITGIKHLVIDRPSAEAIKPYGGEPALKDYRWDPRGFEVPYWPRIAAWLFSAAALTVFLAVFQPIVFDPEMGETWTRKGFFILLDLILILVWWRAFKLWRGTSKMGRLRIEFTRFPYRRPEPAVIRWLTPGGLNHIDKGTFTLRCVEEWSETFANTEESVLFQEQVWAGTWFLDQPRDLPPATKVELSYDLPPSAPPSSLSTIAAVDWGSEHLQNKRDEARAKRGQDPLPRPPAEGKRTVFWELEAKLASPGRDFNESYLVPIY